MAEEEKNQEQAAGGSNKMMMILIILIIVLLLAVAGVAAMLLLGGKEDASAEGQTTEQAAQAGQAAEEPAVPKGPPQYYSLSPAFTVNFKDPGNAHYLQVEVQVLTYQEEAVAAMEMHSPRIRNDLILLFSEQNSRELMTAEGKLQLKNAALEKIRNIVHEVNPKLEVEDLYFTSFVMQ